MSVNLDEWSNAFLPNVKPRLLAAILDVIGDRDPAQIVGLGIYTDADAISVVAAANTADNLAAQTRAEPEDAEYYRWAPQEWDLNTVNLVEAGGADALADTCHELEAVAQAVDRGEAGSDTMHEFRFITWYLLVTALAQLFAEGAFDAYPNAIHSFEAFDAEVDDETLRDWMGQINTGPAAAAYSAWLATA